MPSVAEVQFKATGQQTVVSAFNSVGTSADGATQKVNQNASAMKSMGTGMKSSVSGIASAASAFATLSLSVVNTWRAYRDLTDAQIAVDKANLRVAKTTEAIRKSEAEVAAIKKESGKGSLESIAFTNKMRLAQQKLDAARKDGKHTAAELAVMQDNINLAQKEGSGTSKKLTDAENKLALQKEQLGVQTDVAKEAQERFNDTQQNFYLSILPTALSGFASLSMAFSGMKGIFSGGGGLIGMFGPIGIAIAGVSLAIVAFQTNFLGLRDAVGGVITWFKERFGAWKDTLQEVFGFIQKGDWSGAFNRIKKAAVDFWNDLKTSVPFFGQVESIVNKIKTGDWEGAFHDIQLAAVSMWAQLKKAVPFFGGVEIFIRQLAGGDWKGAWNTIAEGAKTAFAGLFGEKGVLKFQLMRDSAVAEFNLLAHTLLQKGGAIDLINQGLAKLGKGDIVGGFSGIVEGINKALAQAKAAFFSWIQTNFGIDLKSLETKALAIGNTILTKIKEGLTFVARTWIDPIITKLLDPATWTSAAGALLGTITAIGGMIFNFIAGAIQGAAKDPKGAASWWGNIGQAIWDGITGWFAANLPTAKVAMEGIAQAFTDAVISSGIAFQNIGITIWNNLVDGFKKGLETANAITTLGGLLTNEVSKAIQTPEWKNLGHVALIEPEVKMDKGVAEAKKGTTTISGMKPKIQVTANTNPAVQLANQARNKINQMKATIQVNARVNMGTLKGFSAGARLSQHGTNTVVKRPTMFIAGEGGRPESVRIKPRGSAGSDGGGGGDVYVGPIYIGEDQVMGQMRRKMNKNQGIFK